MISAQSSPGAPAVWVPLVAIATLCILTAAGGEPVTAALRFDRAAIGHGEWWRLLSGNFVHLGTWHLVLNLASLVLLALLCPEVLPPWAWGLRLAVIGTGMGLGLYWFVPRLETYVGLSGLIYGLFALGLGRQALGRDKIAIAACAFLAARIAWELIVGAPASEEALVGGRIAGESHVYGVVSALIYGGVTLVWVRIEKARSAHAGGI